MPRKKTQRGSEVVLAQRILRLNNSDLAEAIAEDSRTCYPTDQPSKPLQIEAVILLVRLKNTFAMAGTGFGKSRIPEMYVHLFAKSSKPVVLVLNPLDALGNNQVQEKMAQNFTAVNLKKLTFNQCVSDEILRGAYNFVYLSPEIFLNNEMFTKLYFNTKFQERLVLTVVDEAHMIYSWGLVASGKAKKSSAHKRHQDKALFRPLYGDMGRRSLKSADNLLEMFGPQDQIPNKSLPPTLVYSGTQNTTLQVMKVINQARGTPTGEFNPNSTLIRRYHSCTGDLDKEDTVKGFEKKDFPMISCTMALGLGQNWKRVRRVFHMGCGDPLCICQMMGRCGRDSKPGLAFLFMEPKRRFGINKIEAVTKANKQMDNTRMDCLAITPMCLRIAFSMDNLYGYIPTNRDDPNYMKEEQREINEGFPLCKCSNCAPKEAEMLQKKMSVMDIDNFEALLDQPESFSDPKLVPKKKRRAGGHKNHTKAPEELTNELAAVLVVEFKNFFCEKYGTATSSLPEEHFAELEAENVAERLNNIQGAEEIKDLIGGKTINAELEMLYNCVVNFQKDC
ncbi:hypothetical protein PCANC_24607 [Puccinia coronata f. sp. avenae]|uniref:DNA 3'-5' helicase n=1 Tax=Puccinia coronata f. sp. avenae TaxID=200324 RepID=A0A2N5TSX6_9BASI|nr:hypothetical protein PCANC_24607 [Puccinia coronata f. sp. avenae]